MKVRFGIVGLGHQGKIYAKLLLDKKIKNGVLSALCSSNPDIEHLCKNQYKEVRYFKDFSKMLESKTIDAVIVCVPHYFHSKLGIKAINNGIHTLVEKPAGVHIKQV